MRLLTTDIYEGAYLLSKGIELEKLWLRGNNGKRCVVFEFAGSEADLLRSNYQKGHAQANVIKFKQSLNELKDRMFSVIRENRLSKGVCDESVYGKRVRNSETVKSY